MILSITLQWLFLANLLICEPGERVANQFNKFGAKFGRCEWNKLPIGIQRMYLISLSDTQQPKNVRTYNSIKCSRETFKKVRTMVIQI